MLFAEDLPIKVLDDEILLYVKVTPKAAHDRLGAVFSNSLKIYVTVAAEAGQANRSVIKLLSKKLEINKTSISIKHGTTSPNKVISIKADREHTLKYLKLVIATT